MAQAENTPKPDDDRPAMDEATHPFASSMERNDPLIAEDYEGWWVSTEGDLFTECATCGDTHVAYTVTRFLDGRDLALADRLRRAAAVGAAEAAHGDLSTCRVFCSECDTRQPAYHLKPTGTPCATCGEDSDERWLNADGDCEGCASECCGRFCDEPESGLCTCAGSYLPAKARDESDAMARVRRRIRRMNALVQSVADRRGITYGEARRLFGFDK